ncbi:MAG TPA: tetratricopeptide repeat protein, partial [Humisphaera sp.]
LWRASERAAANAARATASAAGGDDLDQAVAQLRRGDYASASLTLDRAEVRIGGPDGPGPLRARLAAARWDAAVAARLRVLQSEATTLYFDERASADRMPGTFRAAFRDAGLGGPGDDPAAVARRVRASDVRDLIVAALDEWTMRTGDDAEIRWAWAVARAADPDPTGWREVARSMPGRYDARVVADLADRASVATQPPALLSALALRLNDSGADPIPLLIRAQRVRPADVPLNTYLVHLLQVRRRYAEAMRYAQAAVTAAPDLPVLRALLARQVERCGRVDEALDLLREAAAQFPESWVVRQALGNTFQRAGNDESALVALDEAVRLGAPADGRVDLIAGCALAHLGRHAEALDRFDRAVARGRPAGAMAGDVRRSLLALGRAGEACERWRAALAVDPPDHAAWEGYAELCLYAGDEAQYRRACRRLLDRFGTATDPSVCERTGRACLLLPPADVGDLRRATALIDRALAAPNPPAPYYRDYYAVAKALADYRAGRYVEVLAVVDGTGPPTRVLGPMPLLLAAMSHHRLGRPAPALAALREAALAYDWSPVESAGPERCMYHVLRREAERLIIPELQAFLDGTYQPRSADERVALTAACR